MFKRKSNLPPRPQHPSANHIVEDLTAAAEDDKFLEKARGINSKLTDPAESQAEDGEYRRVKTFLEKNQDLLKTMQELKAMGENLNACSAEISVLAEDLKEQAIKALL